MQLSANETAHLSSAALAASALEWYLDHGVDEVLDDQPMDAFALAELLEQERAAKLSATIKAQHSAMGSAMQGAGSDLSATQAAKAAAHNAASNAPILGAQEAQKKALEAANAAQTLDDLKKAIEAFDGLDLKATASNMVFASGDPSADLMVIGEAPSADDERASRPLAGPQGALFDRALACIGRSRDKGDDHANLYLTNLLNWRPPGDRTPSQSEIAISLPFIERHIALVEPKVIMICGAGAAKALLGCKGGISRLRKIKYQYSTQTQGLDGALNDIPTIATFTPAYVLSTPAQKRGFWQDLLTLQDMLNLKR